MPRSSRSSGGRPAPGGSRGMSTSAQRPAQPAQHSNVPAHQQQAPPPAQYAPQQRQPGLFANMASTAAGVAVGSSVGHGISNMLFGGGGSSAPAPEAQQQAMPEGYNQQQPGAWGQSSQQMNAGGNCEGQSKEFIRCLESTNNDMQSCGYYLEALKACQAAARPY